MTVETRWSKVIDVPYSPNPINIYRNSATMLTDGAGTGQYRSMPPPNNFGNRGDLYFTDFGAWVSIGNKWWLMGTNFLYP